MKAYLSVTKIADVTGKERTAVVRWIKAGKFGKARKVGKEYRVPHEAFKKWWDLNMKGVKRSERQR